MFRNLTSHTLEGDYIMRRDLRLLCHMLRREILLERDDSVWQDGVKLRQLAVRHEAGDEDANQALASYFAQASLDHMNRLIRVLGIFFELANVSEDLQRERVLEQRRAEHKLHDSLEAGLDRLKQHMDSPRDIQSLLECLEAEFVLTAHPTEAKRQTIRQILARIRENLGSLPTRVDRPENRRSLLGDLHEDVRALLRTDFLHSHRPVVLEELGRALYVSHTLWLSAPALSRSVEQALGRPCRPVRFGCWIGGDRDGHPHVTVDVTRQTLLRLRRQALDFHLDECRYLVRRLTMLPRNRELIPALQAIVEKARCPAFDERLARFHPEEHYRRVLESIKYRLYASREHSENPSIAYPNAHDLEQDLQTLHEALKADNLQGSAMDRLEDWIHRTRIFGLHLMRLDIRENSQGYRTLMKELLELFGEDPGRVDRNEFEGLWKFHPAWPAPAEIHSRLTERSRDLLEVTRLMQDWAADHGEDGIGVNVISMTHSVEDVLWVQWLHEMVAQYRGCPEGPVMPVTPLFETVDDLHAASGILSELFSHPVYRKRLQQQGNRQVVMIGYSDSAKDGGYLAACWALYQGEETMIQAAAKAGIELTCFHGRGGALGRGGGPAARAIQALPPAGGDAHIRMTEQGEVIADRFADPALAHRHMEQILGGVLVHALEAKPPPDAWRQCIEAFADAAREHYLELFQSPGFADYFQEATPFSCIVSLPIGSRPSRRSGVDSLDDLRAIPYTFSWTQSRQLINAFYGLGAAWDQLPEAQKECARTMYREWAFFRSMIDNAELALTKCDAVIARQYAALVSDDEVGRRLGDAVVQEIHRTRNAVLEITGRSSLMAESNWLRRSVEIRKPYIDVLNYIQIELLKRQRANQEDPEALSRSLRLSVQGIAAGLRTTG